MEITLSRFVDFAVETGAERAAVVREAKERAGVEYEMRTDFWGPLREQIATLHRTGRMSAAQLDAWMGQQTNARRIPSYSSRVDGYKHFLSKHTLEWFRPPRGVWVDGDLTVNVSPELGLMIDGQRTLTKLYFRKGKGLTAKRAQASFALMREAFPGLSANTRVAILDVGAGSLLLPDQRWKMADLGAVLRAEARSFLYLWDAL